MKYFVPILLLATGFTHPQDAKTGLTKTKKAVPAVSGYVTEADAKVVFARAEKMLRKVTGSKAVVSSISLAGSAPITREKTIFQLQRLYSVVEPQVKLMPRPVKVNATVLKIGDPAKATLVKFVKMGAVGNYSLLATGPQNKLTPKEFGDALGFFLARMAQMTHTPSREWSPPLMDGN